ncbi:MAG: energy transducer TonB [Verrucomicrobia bacterium]|nr:energy transducer TonB [Verrucomicrobiota bacterium]
MRSPLRVVGLLGRFAGVWFCVSPLARSVAAAEPNNEQSLQILRLASFTMPEFPDFVRMTGTFRGVVTAAIGRDAEGYVTDVFVLSSDNARLTESVIAAVKKWRFAHPAQRPLPGRELVPVKFFVDESGKVRVPVILECTAPDLGQAAIVAVEQWRFDPPRISGRPTIVRETLKLDFTPVPPSP